MVIAHKFGDVIYLKILSAMCMLLLLKSACCYCCRGQGASAASKSMLLLLQSACCYCYRLCAATAEHMIKTAAKCILQNYCYIYNAIYCFYDAVLFLWCSLLFLWCSIPFLWCFLLFLWCSLLFLLSTASNAMILQLGPNNNNNNKLQQPADRLLEAGKKTWRLVEHPNSGWGCRKLFILFTNTDVL